jgi:signal transduction histidine kinase
VTSDPGRGTCFILELPERPPEAATARGEHV